MDSCYIWHKWSLSLVEFWQILRLTFEFYVWQSRRADVISGRLQMSDGKFHKLIWNRYSPSDKCLMNHASFSPTLLVGCHVDGFVLTHWKYCTEPSIYNGLSVVITTMLNPTNQSINANDSFYPRPVLAFGYCCCLRLSVCASVCVLITCLSMR